MNYGNRITLTKQNLSLCCQSLGQTIGILIFQEQKQRQLVVVNNVDIHVKIMEDAESNLNQTGSLQMIFEIHSEIIFEIHSEIIF